MPHLEKWRPYNFARIIRHEIAISEYFATEAMEYTFILTATDSFIVLTKVTRQHNFS